MDDQDRLSQSVGGNASFFINDLEDFAWHTLFDAKLSNQDRANLYIEGIEKLSKALHLPKLFQDIFKDAFLPFRASDTIAMFLDCLNGFDYAHSEELGNAFEYLLSIMGSQGNAGQFRTPRHIIEFLVDAVNPQKTETILDPACGTAGFLVEAYTHIVQNNQLSPQDKQSLSTNIFGVDIDPGMAKIARVNLYLHGFKTPNITEDDTLTNEKLWEKKYDVILANPPFMTPKGGIVPHDKFEISANRSEVLFVDYIAEHLKLNGRAGIIVPEGIIFQSANAYKALRKKLVEDWGLCAVISLPSGVFQPYSGVKTSILILDRKKASETDTVLFVKIENDGFDLGAQRREIAKNDLPKALEILKEWQKNSSVIASEAKQSLAFAVTKKEIAQNGEWNLTGERYKEVKKYDNAKFPMVELGEVCEIKTGKKDVNQGNSEGKYPFFTCAKEHTFSDEYSFDTEALLVAGNGDVGSVKYYKGKFEAYQRTYIISEFKKILPKYLFHLLFLKLKETVSSQKLGNTMPYIKLGMLTSFKIPLPPLEIQEKIVAEIEQYQKIIDGAKQVVQNWKPSIKISPEWEMVELGEVFLEIKNGKNVEQFDKTGKYKVSRIQTIANGTVNLDKTKNTNDEVNEHDFLQEGDILFSHINSFEHLAKTALFEKYLEKVVHGANLIRLRPNFEKVLPKFALSIFKMNTFIDSARIFAQKAVNQASINTAAIKSLKIPLPPLEIQEKIVAEIAAEQNAVEECKKLIAVYEKKIEAKIGEVWGE